MTRRFKVLAAAALLAIVPRAGFAQASSFDMGSVTQFVDILNCCGHFAVEVGSAPGAISVSGPPWPLQGGITNEYGAANASSSMQYGSASNSGVSFTATVSGGSSPGPAGGLRAAAGQGGTYYSFVLDQANYVELHASVDRAHSGQDDFGVSFSLLAGSSAGGAIAGFSYLAVSNSSDPKGDTLNTPPGGVLLGPGTYVLIAGVSDQYNGWATNAAGSFSLTLSVTLLIHTAPDGPVIGTINCEGNATLNSQPVTPNEPVHMGDLVETLATARCFILFIDGTQCTISEKTKLTINEYVFDPTNSAADKANYSFLQGVFQYVSGLITKTPKPDVNIFMPYGSLGIRGTELIGRPDPTTPDGEEVDLIEGHVDITPWNNDVTTGFDGPITIRFDNVGIRGTASLSQAGYDAIKNALFPASTPPPLAFNGFFSPVANSPSVNQVKAGAAVPVKFSLGGDQGLNIFAAGYPASQQTACGSTLAVNILETTTSAGGSNLTYDATTNQYTYIWKTDAGWKNTCRNLTVKLTDGTDHKAVFQFK